MCIIDKKNNKNQTLEELVTSKYNETSKKYHNLIDIVVNTDFLENCYSKNQKILDNKNSKWFQKVSNEIRDGSYKPKPRNIVYIKKEKKHPIESSSRDKMIQVCFTRILFTIYELSFSNYSYSFSADRGVHMALKQVKGWNDISWLISLDIEKSFDKINIKKLINILKLKIDDQRFFDILNKFFNSKILSITFKSDNSIRSVLESNMLSLLLLNIYLNEFDKFIESLMLEFNKGKERKRNTKYRSATEWRKFTNKTISERNRVLKNLRKQGITSTNLRDPNYKKIRYARYADNFVIGIAGDKKFAKQIMDKIKVFLQTELHLNVLEKKIPNLISIVHRQAFFLGFFLKKAPKRLNPVISQNLKGKEKRARILKRLKHELFMMEQRELKKIKNNLKRAIAKSLSKNQKYKNVDSDLINKVSQIVAKERRTNSFFEKPFFSDSTLKTLMFANKSDIPKDILEKFISFQEAVASNYETTNLEIHLSKTKGKYMDENGNEQKVITKQVDLPIQIYAPTDIVKKSLKDRGIISKKGRPQAFNFIITEADETIIKWYASLAQSYLTFYSCADNFYKIKSIVNYHVRWSMFHSLAKKHKMTLSKLFKIYGQEFEGKNDLQNIFPSKSRIASVKKGFLTREVQYNPQEVLNKLYLKKTQLSLKQCSVENCKNIDIEMHHTSHLKTRVENSGFSVLTRKGKRVRGWKAYAVSKSRKQRPYCEKHHYMLHAGKLIFKDKKIFDPDLQVVD